MSEHDRWHSVALDCESGWAKFECTAPEGAECRSLPRCQHHGGPCADYEGGHGDPNTCDLTPVDTGECVIAAWINEGDECGRGELRIPVTTEWVDDWWTWTPADTHEAYRRGQEDALRAAADERGVNVGDEDDEWWSGYRQAQREVIHWLSDRADRIEADINEGSEA